MTDEEWAKWGRTLRVLVDRVNLADDLEELKDLADGLEQDDSEGDEYLSRNHGTSWTWYMGGDWMEPVSDLQTHLEGFDPKDFNAYVARRRAANEEVQK